MSAPPVSFELERFKFLPAAGEQGLVQLSGHWHGQGAPAGAPVALAAQRGGAVERFAPLAGRSVSLGAGAWRATFAVPMRLLEDVAVAFRLDGPGGTLVALPAPERPDTRAEGEHRQPESPAVPTSTGFDGFAVRLSDLQAEIERLREWCRHLEAERAEQGARLNEERSFRRQEGAAALVKIGELIGRTERALADHAVQGEARASRAEDRAASLESQLAAAERELDTARAQVVAERREREEVGRWMHDTAQWFAARLEELRSAGGRIAALRDLASDWQTQAAQADERGERVIAERERLEARAARAAAEARAAASRTVEVEAELTRVVREERDRGRHRDVALRHLVAEHHRALAAAKARAEESVARVADLDQRLALARQELLATSDRAESRAADARAGGAEAERAAKSEQRDELAEADFRADQNLAALARAVVEQDRANDRPQPGR